MCRALSEVFSELSASHGDVLNEVLSSLVHIPILKPDITFRRKKMISEQLDKIREEAQSSTTRILASGASNFCLYVLFLP